MSSVSPVLFVAFVGNFDGAGDDPAIADPRHVEVLSALILRILGDEAFGGIDVVVLVTTILGRSPQPTTKGRMVIFAVVQTLQLCHLHMG